MLVHKVAAHVLPAHLGLAQRARQLACLSLHQVGLHGSIQAGREPLLTQQVTQAVLALVVPVARELLAEEAAVAEFVVLLAAHGEGEEGLDVGGEGGWGVGQGEGSVACGGDGGLGEEKDIVG